MNCTDLPMEPDRRFDRGGILVAERGPVAAQEMAAAMEAARGSAVRAQFAAAGTRRRAWNHYPEGNLVEVDGAQ